MLKLEFSKEVRKLKNQKEFIINTTINQKMMKKRTLAKIKRTLKLLKAPRKRDLPNLLECMEELSEEYLNSKVYKETSIFQCCMLTLTCIMLL